MHNIRAMVPGETAPPWSGGGAEGECADNSQAKGPGPDETLESRIRHRRSNPAGNSVRRENLSGLKQRRVVLTRL